MKLLELAKKYAAGKAEPEDFAGMAPADVLAIRTDSEMGCNRLAATVPFAATDVGPQRKLADVADDDSPVPYVMLTEHPIGRMRDLYKINGFSFERFERRGRPLLYHHNLEEGIERPPLGNMSKPTRHRKFEGLRALHGYASFAPRGLNAFGDMIQDLVRAGVLTGGSVGMEVVQARSPKDEKEAQKLGIEPFSLIVEDMMLEEFSVTPLGRDENAQAGVVLSAGAEDQTLAMLVEGVREGRYDREMVAAFRESTPGLEPPLRILSNGINLPSEADPNQKDDMNEEVDPRVEALESRLARLEEQLEERGSTLAAVEDRCTELEGMVETFVEGAEALAADSDLDETDHAVGRALYDELLASDMTDEDIEELLRSEGVLEEPAE